MNEAQEYLLRVAEKRCKVLEVDGAKEGLVPTVMLRELLKIINSQETDIEGLQNEVIDLEDALNGGSD